MHGRAVLAMLRGLDFIVLLHKSRPATRPGRNGGTVRTGRRMTQERTDFIRSFLRKNVFELAGLLGDLGLVLHVQAVGKEPLGQPMPPNDVSGALSSASSHLDHVAAFGCRISHRRQLFMAGIVNRLVLMNFRRMW